MTQSNVDRLQLLRELERAASRRLDLYALKLLLLFVACCNEKGEGRISIAQVRRALGRTTDILRIVHLGLLLERAGVLEEFALIRPNPRAPRNVVVYRLRAFKDIDDEND